MCEIMDRVLNKGRNEGWNEGRNAGRNEGQDEIFILWNWLQKSGRSDEAIELMNSSDKNRVKTLLAEYEISIQKK